MRVYADPAIHPDVSHRKVRKCVEHVGMQVQTTGVGFPGWPIRTTHRQLPSFRPSSVSSTTDPL
eukprot:2872434-Lingulodinium_polyedra.AAC.1